MRASYLVCWEIHNSAPAAVKMSNAGLGKGEGRIVRRRTGKNLQQYTCERLSCLTTAYHISCSFRLSPSRQNNQPLHNHRDSHIQLLFSSAMIQTKTQLFLDCSWSSVDLINPSDAPSHLSQIWLREISGCLVIAFNFFVVKDWLKPVEANNWLPRGGVCVKHTQEAWISHEAYKSNKSSDPWRRNLI